VTYDTPVAVSDYMDWARERVRVALTHGAPERVVGVFVVSIDLVAAVEGRTAALTSEADRALLRAWRETADALLVGTGTLTAELYAGSMMPEQARQTRVRRGQRRVPPILTIDRTGTLDLDAALRGDDPPPLVIYTGRGQARVDKRADWVELSDPTVSRVLSHARELLDARVVVLEGGPLLMRAALEEGAITDLSLTLTPRYIGSGPRLLAPRWEKAPVIEPLRPETVDDHVFIHYLIAPIRMDQREPQGGEGRLLRDSG